MPTQTIAQTNQEQFPQQIADAFLKTAALPDRECVTDNALLKEFQATAGTTTANLECQIIQTVILNVFLANLAALRTVNLANLVVELPVYLVNLAVVVLSLEEELTQVELTQVET